MEFRDLKRQYARHKTEINSCIQNVLMSSNFIGGEVVKRLEERLADYVGVSHCITCANGTDALLIALLTWGISKGDAVFVPDFTFFSTAEVVPWVNATPVFVDIDKDTFNISPMALERAIQYVQEETKLIPKVVIAVDLFGQPADFPEIKKITEKYGLLLLEDGAQGFGGAIGEQRACSFGDISTTSFFPAKPLGCYGDGGAVFTNNDEWNEKIRSLCVHGKGADKYENIRIGMNSRLDTLQAAVLLEKLNFFAEEVEKCNQIAKEYTSRLSGYVKTPVIKKSMFSSWAQYTICFHNYKERENAIKVLKEDSIPSAVYYKKPMHLQKAFDTYELKGLEYAVTEDVCNQCLSLPIHAYLYMEDIQYVTNRLLTFIETNAKRM